MVGWSPTLPPEPLLFTAYVHSHMLAVSGNSHVEWVEGNLEDYEQDKIQRLGVDAVEPKRIRDQKFKR